VVPNKNMISSWPDGAWFFRSSCFVVHAGGGHLQGRRGLDVADGEHLLLADDPQRFAARTLELMGNAELAFAWPPTPAAWSSNTTTGAPSAAASHRW